MKINILPIGRIDGDLLQELAESLEARVGEVALLPSVAPPEGALDPSRGSFRASAFLDLVRTRDGEKVLGVTEADLTASRTEWVFGYAEVGGRAAVVSVNRLRAGDQRQVVARLLKEAIHELGHTRGLQHCGRRSCVMHFSETVADTDAKSVDFCPECTSLLHT